jgi:hypothetical protein
MVACSDVSEPPPEPIVVPTRVEPPTPPPLPPGDDIGSMLPAEPPLPPGSRPRPKPAEPTPAPEPEPTIVPAGAKALTFERVVLATAVVDRVPTGVTDSFPDGAEVSCWMSVTNPGPKRRLRAEWFHGDTRKSSIGVTIKGPSWRTWTSRPVFGTGAWRVDIVDEAGTVLHSVPFEVK